MDGTNAIGSKLLKLSKALSRLLMTQSREIIELDINRPVVSAVCAVRDRLSNQPPHLSVWLSDSYLSSCFASIPTKPSPDPRRYTADLKQCNLLEGCASHFQVTLVAHIFFKLAKRRMIVSYVRFSLFLYEIFDQLKIQLRTAFGTI